MMSLAVARTVATLVCIAAVATCSINATIENAEGNGRCRPSQIHLALTGDPTEMRISWKTTHSGCPSKVHYGTSKEAVERRANAEMQAAATAQQQEGGTEGQRQQQQQAGAEAGGPLAHPSSSAAEVTAVASARAPVPRRALASWPQQQQRDGAGDGMGDGGAGDGTGDVVVSVDNVNGDVVMSLAGASETSYGSEDMCAAPARDYKYDEQFFQSSVLTGLTSGADYYYRLHGDSRVRSFRAAPAVGDTEARFTFLAYGDMGESEHASAKSPGAADTAYWVRKEVEEQGAAMVVHVGDIAYADGNPDVWDTFMHYIEPSASRVPYMVMVGNHEYCYKENKQFKHHKHKQDASGEHSPYDPSWGNYGNDSGGECGVPFKRRFAMPEGPAARAAAFAAAAAAMANSSSSSAASPSTGPGSDDASSNDEDDYDDDSGGDDGDDSGANKHHSHHGPPAPNSPFWYSFEYGPVAFIALSTEHNLSPGSKQYRWLEAALTSVDRCATPWLLVLMHRPMYVVFPHKSNRVVADHIRSRVESLLNHYEVDLVLSGHVHDYARTCNVLDQECVSPEHGGMSHVTLGCAGHKLSYVESSQEKWLAHAEMEFGYGRVTVLGGSKMLFEMVATRDGTVHDSVELSNPRAERRNCPAKHAAGQAPAPARDAGGAAAVAAASVA